MALQRLHETLKLNWFKASKTSTYKQEATIHHMALIWMHNIWILQIVHWICILFLINLALLQSNWISEAQHS